MRLVTAQLYVDSLNSYGETEFNSCDLEHRQTVANILKIVCL